MWTKAGTVHISSPKYDDVRELRLERVGDWAGCNSLARCVGESISDNGNAEKTGIQALRTAALVIVSSSLTYHIINNYDTDPALAPPIESLSATKAARKAMLARRVMQLRPAPDKAITSSTGAWATLDDWGGVACWISE